MSGSGDLVVEDLHVQYGPAKALFGISLEVTTGSVLAVLGPNGAGKSTLARAVSGLVPVTSGSVTFAGTDITRRPAHRIRRAGLTYLPEGRGIFPGLSVMENLRMATRQLNRGDRAAATELAIELFPILGDRRRQRAGTLSGGEQQMLALARALAVDPTLIIADELSLGLAPIVADHVFEGLEHAREIGITVILIEQFIHRALELADRCAILSRGKVSWTGPSNDASDEVLKRYLGDAGAAEQQHAG